MDTGGLREDTTKEGKMRRIHPRELTGGERTSRRRRVLTSVAALTAVGGFLADWNRTHLFNPKLLDQPLADASAPCVELGGAVRSLSQEDAACVPDPIH